MKSARWEANRSRNIEYTITIEMSQRPKNRRVADAVALVRAQAAVRVYDEGRHIVRRIIKYDKIGRAVAIHVTRFQVIADPQIFQNT